MALPDPNAILQSLYQKRIILVQEVDFDMADLQIVYWIAKGGVRIDGPEAQQAHVMENTYVQFPPIPITILGHGPAPDAPPPHLLTPEYIIGYMMKLASRRNEWSSFNKGIYVSLDIIGLRYSEVGGRFFPVKSDLSPSHVYLPQVADYNFMLRLLKIYPKNMDSHMVEPKAWAATNSQQRTRLMVLYTAILSSCTTTCAYDLNICTNHLVQWAIGLQVPDLSVAVMTSNFNAAEISGSTVEPIMKSAPKKGFPILLNCSVIDNLYIGVPWLCDLGGIPQAAEHYAPYPGTIPPQLFTILCVDNFISIRLIEWGISGPNPKVDLYHETVIEAEGNRAGWFAYMGTSNYSQTAASGCPMKLDIYGVMALNIILQYIDVAQQPLLSRNRVPWSPNGVVQWDAPVPIPGDQVDWVGPLRVIQPCTLMTFTYENRSIWAPAYTQPNIPFQMLTQLNMLRNTTIMTAGFGLRSIKPTTSVFHLPASLTLSLIGGIQSTAVNQMDNANTANNQ
jgi:hypothetical protein